MYSVIIEQQKKIFFEKIIKITILFLLFLAFMLGCVTRYFTKYEYDNMVVKGEEGLNRWFENHPEFKYKRILHNDLYSYDDYWLPYIECTYYDENDEWQRLYYDINNENVLIELSNRELSDMFGDYYSDYCGFDREMCSYSLYFFRKEHVSLYRKHSFLFFSWGKYESENHEFNDCMLYEEYAKCKLKPSFLFEDIKNEFSITIYTEENICEHDFKLYDFINTHSAIQYIDVYNKKTEEDLRVERDDTKYDMSYRAYTDYNYNQIMQIKYMQSLDTTLPQRYTPYELVCDFRNKVQNGEELFDVNISNSGIDIKTSVNDYRIYFSSIKFLEGQAISYIQPYSYGDEKEVICTFKEVNNGKYPYALAKENNRIVSFWGDESFNYK